MTLEAWVYPTVNMSQWATVVLKEQPGGGLYELYANPGGRPKSPTCGHPKIPHPELT